MDFFLINIFFIKTEIFCNLLLNMSKLVSIYHILRVNHNWMKWVCKKYVILCNLRWMKNDHNFKSYESMFIIWEFTFLCYKPLNFDLCIMYILMLHFDVGKDFWIFLIMKHILNFEFFLNFTLKKSWMLYKWHVLIVF